MPCFKLKYIIVRYNLNLKQYYSMELFKQKTIHNFQLRQSINLERPRKPSINQLKLLKLNHRKFPGDFFGDSTKSLKKNIQNSINNRYVLSNKKLNQNIIHIDNQQILPEAQVTSFFKMAIIQSSPTQVINQQTQNSQNQNKQTIKHHESLCCTFARKLTGEKKKVQTPSKNKNNGKRINRTVNLNRTPNLPISKRKKLLKDKEIMVSQFHVHESTRSLKKIKQDFVLPKINRIN